MTSEEARDSIEEALLLVGGRSNIGCSGRFARCVLVSRSTFAARFALALGRFTTAASNGCVDRNSTLFGVFVTTTSATTTALLVRIPGRDRIVGDDARSG